MKSLNSRKLDNQRDNRVMATMPFPGMFLLALVLCLPIDAIAAPSPETSQGSTPRTLLAIFAHPDDEISLGPLLARYAAEGHTVHLVTATSGQVGDARTDVPRGDQLGSAREEELRCSARALGIEPPTLLRFMDGDIAGWETVEAIRERLREQMAKWKPDVVLTWGPEGLSGHPDHRLISGLATEVFQEALEDAPAKLYYFVYPHEAVVAAGETRHPRRTTTPEEFVTTRIEASDFMTATRRAMECHQTQWPGDIVPNMYKQRQEVTGGTVSLRLALSRVGMPAPGTVESDLLERLVPSD